MKTLLLSQYGRSCVLGFVLAIISSGSFSEVLSTVDEAQNKLFPEAYSFERLSMSLSREEAKAIKKAAKVRVFTDRILVWRAVQSDVTTGWFITDKVIGKHELITYALAVDLQGNVLGLEILEYLETHGGEVRGSQWRQQFVGKNLVNSEFKLGKDVDGLSGATLSSRNITDGVRKLLYVIEAIKAQGANRVAG